MEVETRAVDLCAAPAGCAFLLHAETSGLAPEVAARPEVAVHLAAAAGVEVSPWDPDHDELEARVLAEGPRLLGLARTILARPEATWWLAPVDRDAQIWIGGAGERPHPSAIVTPTGESDRWERYAQKARGDLFTSTHVDGTSSVLATLGVGMTDYADAVSLPFALHRFQVAEEARVFEVDGPAAWRRLCLRYPDVGEDGRLVPRWAGVAADWDGVHLTLGGWLTAEQVRMDGPEGWTQHDGWDFEQTRWLRWVFPAVAPQVELSAYPGSPVPLGWPDALRLLDEMPWRKVIRPEGRDEPSRQR